jgi:asparaginyl-tRNA synthetase
VDENAGNDQTGKGTEDAPYQTIVHALQQQPTAQVMVRKTDEKGVAKYQPASNAALKKARKRIEELARKLKKQEQQKAEQEAQEKQRRAEEERKLEEAKKIVLKEDPSLPAARKVK